MTISTTLTALTPENEAHFAECLQYSLEQLAKYEPFYLYPLYRLKVSPVFSTMSAYGYTNGKDICMVYPLAQTLTPAQFAGVIYHELLHILCLHIPRKGNRFMSVWNAACDVSVNGVVQSQEKSSNNNIVDAPYPILDPASAHLAVEVIYDMMMEGKLPNFRVKMEANGTSSPFSDDNKDAPPKRPGDNAVVYMKGKDGNFYPINPPDMIIDIGDFDLLSEEVKKLIREARMAVGNIGKGIDRHVIDILDKVKVDWKRELRKYINQHISDYSFMRKDRRFQSSKYFIPGVEPSARGSLKIAVGIDLSGSIGDSDITKMISECVGIEKQFQSVEFTFIPFDVDTYGRFTATTKADIITSFKKFKGGGGTSFVKVLEELDQKDTLVILMFTDLYGTFPDKKPRADVIWLDIGKYTGKVPFGRVIKYESGT